MAIYTMTVRELMEQGFDFGLDTYPIWDESARDSLNSALLTHYYLREIGLETPRLFRFCLNRAMNEIMPYYCELWKTTQYNIDPTNAINVTEIYQEIAKTNDNLTGRTNSDGSFSEHGTTETNATRTPNLKSQTIYTDTPQTITNTGDIANNLYMTNASVTNEAGTDKNESLSSNFHETTTRAVNRNTQNRTENKNTDYTRTRKGNEFYNVSELIKSYRETIISIEQEIINNPAIADCFMKVW